MLNPGYTVELITTEEMLSGLEGDWNELSRNAEHPNVFTTYDWFRTWYRFFLREKHSRWQLNVLALRRDGMLKGIVPLVRRVSERLGFVVLSLEFESREWDYNDLVLGDDPIGQTMAVMHFLARRRKEWDVIDLRDLSATESSMGNIESALRSAGLSYRLSLEKERCPFMPIDGSWAEILGRHSHSTRHTFRMQQNRLNGMMAEGLKVRIVEDPSSEPRLLEKMIALESQKRVGDKVLPPFLGWCSEVFRTLFGTLGPRGWFCIAVMELNDRLLAWQLMFRCGRKLWVYLMAHDHEYSRLSPGTMLLPAIVDHGISHGITEYDFLRGEEPYKLQWSTGLHSQYRLIIWNRTLKSRLHKAFRYDLKEALARTIGRRA